MCQEAYSQHWSRVSKCDCRWTWKVWRLQNTGQNICTDFKTRASYCNTPSCPFSSPFCITLLARQYPTATLTLSLHCQVHADQLSIPWSSTTHSAYELASIKHIQPNYWWASWQPFSSLLLIYAHLFSAERFSNFNMILILWHDFHVYTYLYVRVHRDLFKGAIITWSKHDLFKNVTILLLMWKLV